MKTWNELIVEMGEELIIEYVPLGVFWSGDWSVPEDGLYAHTTGRDRLELLRQSTYDTGEVEQDKSLYDLAVDVLSDAGLTVDEYWIDPMLENFIVPYSFFVSQSHREALRKIAEACVGQVYCDREGIVRVEGPGEGKELWQTETVFGVTPDEYFRKDNPAKWSEVANYIEVETQPLKPEAMTEVYSSSESVPIAAGQEVVITAQYNYVPCIDATASLKNAPTGAQIVKEIYYAGSAEITVSSTASGTFELVINAKPLKVQNKELVVAQDAGSIGENGVMKYTFPGNPLVQTRQMAQMVADTILSFYKDPRRDIEMDWRGNPAIELGDVIAAPDHQRGGTIGKWGYFLVTRQELEYTGALRARLAGRRVTG